MNSVTKPILLFHFCLSVIVAIDVTCDRVNPLIQSDVTCTCKNAPGTSIDWLIDDVFNSNCVLSSICAPQYSGYSYSMNTTETIYEMTINSYNYSYCTKMTCKDTSDGSIMQSIIPSSLVFDTTFPTSMTEPGSNNSNGIISVTTGCISGFSDVQYDWYFIVSGLEERYVVYDTNIIDTIENSPCVNCDTDVNGQRTIGFEHSEASVSGTKTGLFKVSLYHVSTNFQLNLTSRYFYTLKANKQIESDGDVLLCNTSCITGISLGIVLLLIIFIVTMVIVYYFVRPKFTNIEILKDTKIHILWTDRLYCCRWCQPIFGYNIVCNPIKGQERDTICRKHSTKKNYYTLRDLDPMAIYEISLSRKLCCFKSSATKRYVITRKAGMLNDQGYDAKSISIDVWWTKPDCINNLQLKYQVTCNELEEQVVHKKEKIRVSSYTIPKLYPNRSYSVYVYPVYHSVTFEPAMIELTTPYKPTELKPTAVKSTMIDVTWKKPAYTNGQRLQYQVFCNEAEVEKTNKTSNTIKNLVPGRTYEIKIFTILKGIHSLPSVKKIPTPSLKVCLKVDGYKPEESCVKCSIIWTVKDFDRPEPFNNPDDEFLYNVKLYSGNHLVHTSKEITDSSYTIPDIYPNHSYTVDVYAIYHSITLTPPGKIQLAPYKPTQLKYTAKSTQIAIEWERPQYTGNQPLTYEVTCDKVRVNTTSKTSYKIENLEPCQQYDIEILTIIHRMKSLPLQETVRTQPCRPDPPEDFQFAPMGVTDTSITVEWKEGFDGGHKQTYYVKVNNEKEKKVNAKCKLRKKNWSYTCKDLEPDTEYYIEITAKNDKGSSKPCYLKSTTTNDFNLANTPGKALAGEDVEVAGNSEEMLQISDLD